MDKIDAKLRARRDALSQEELGQRDDLVRANFFDLDAGIFPSSERNTITAYTNGNDAFDAFAKAISEATHHVHFEFYIWESDDTGTRFRDLLVACAKRGVEVRALYDAIGGAAVHGKFMKPLIEAGGHAAPFLPVNLLERRLRINFRNHRKIIVIDGKVAFTGGINIANEYRDWHDTAYQLEGPVVYQLQEVFAEDWFFATKEELVDERYFPEPDEAMIRGDARARILASGPDTRAQSIHKAFFLAMTHARERIWLITPYFIPDQAILMALETAAMRGVNVRILIPSLESSDVRVTYWAGRAFYERLLEAGVELYEFSGKILHAKHLLVDENWSFVGSSNMDIRSFRLNFETNCIVEHVELNTKLASFFEDSIAQCSQVDLEAFYERPRTERLFEATMRLFSPLL